MYDVQTGQATQIAKHDATIRVVKYVDTPSGGIVVTGSWDKTVKVRDYRVTRADVHSPGSLVLGYPKSKPRILCHSPRTLLQSRCILPTDGGRNGRATYPDFQPNQPHCGIQGETWARRIFSRTTNDSTW